MTTPPPTPGPRVLSESTQRTHAVAWALFSDWCAVTGDWDLPAEPATGAGQSASAQGGVTIAVRTAADNVILTVTDTGIGIPPDEQSRVFDRFYRSPQSSLGGAGIGLALVADLAHAHGGEVRVTSAPGMGSTFTVTVPLTVPGQNQPPLGDKPGVDQDGRADRDAAISGPAGRGTVHSPDSARTDGRGRQPTRAGSPVMVVEDDPDLRAYLTRLLSGDGWSVLAFGDAEAVLAFVRADNDDPAIGLLLTDVMLPGRSGLELVALMRANSTTARVPIIVLTARGGAAAAAEGLTAGADDYVTKPFTSPELLARVRANIELHHIREQAVDAAETRARQIRSGMDSNRIIGTAIGVLMATYRLTAEQGFQLLQRASQDHNRKLRDLAAVVASTGKLPFRPTDNDDLLIKIGPVQATMTGDR